MNLFDEVPIGSVLYGVHEHLYHDENRIPRKEYVVKREEVMAHYEYGFREIRTSDGATPYYYQRKDIGKKIFFTAKEAAEKANEKADADDATWVKYGEHPMRRTFLKYLEEDDEG